MGIQARNVRRERAIDIEKAPLIDDDGDVNGMKDHPRASIADRARALLPWGMLFGVLLYLGSRGLEFPFPSPAPAPLPPFVREGMKQCELIARPPPDHKPFTGKRTRSDRFVEGTRAVWLKNATVWTGEDDGEEVLYATDVWLEGGVVRHIGKPADMAAFVAGDKDKNKDVDEVELHGAWVTPGIVDMHSHMGVDALPDLEGAGDTNSWHGPILPWLRSLDGFNTHDKAFNGSIAGGITTMLVLPGSAGNIGGQAFTFKPRWTAENTPQSMQVEPPFVISSDGKWERTRAWRHIKHACGENPHRVYGNTRMDSAYDFRRAYTEGRKLKEEQERWCASPKTQTEPFPDSLEWEVMADILRHNVLVNIHCYETVDLNDMVRISNEFQFPIAAFHHAHEAYLVPDLLKQNWGGKAPTVAIFANEARYKREAYRGTPYAAKILADAGINVAMKSDHPVLDSRYLIFEAAQAHAFGLNASHALSSVTTHPANAAGLGHRMGYVRAGYDADLVVWDSYPLTIGATPQQTYIDGIAQIIKPHVAVKPHAAQKISPAGDYDKEAAEAVASRGDPDLRPKRRVRGVVFDGVKAMYLPGNAAVAAFTSQNEGGEPGRVVVRGGEIACIGAECVVADAEYDTVDLKGGSLAPGIIATGAKLGLVEIVQEATTSDGRAYDPMDAPKLLEGLLVRGADGARFDSKDQLMAYREGVTVGVTPPFSSNLFAGLSYAFATGALHPLERGAIANDAAALHLDLDNEGTSTSTKIALLRRLLAKAEHEQHAHGDLAAALQRVATGELRLTVAVESADVISALVRLKREVAPQMKLTLIGAHEAWLVADDLAAEHIGVVVSNARSFPMLWDMRRILPGPPLTNLSLPAFLADRGVKVGLGRDEECDARLTRFEAAWAYADAPHVFSKQDAVDLVSANLAELLGLNDRPAVKYNPGIVAYEGDMFSFEGRVRAVVAPGGDAMDLF